MFLFCMEVSLCNTSGNGSRCPLFTNNVLHSLIFRLTGIKMTIWQVFILCTSFYSYPTNSKVIFYSGSCLNIFFLPISKFECLHFVSREAMQTSLLLLSVSHGGCRLQDLGSILGVSHLQLLVRGWSQKTSTKPNLKKTSRIRTAYAKLIISEGVMVVGANVED